MKILKSLFAIALIVTLFGCASSNTQRILYKSTDAFGAVVDKACIAFEDFEVTKAIQALGPQATRQQITEWVHNDPAWKNYAPMKENFNQAYVAWCSVNATLVSSGTNAVSVMTAAQFKQNAITAAVKVTAFIVQFVPSIKTVQP